MTLLPRFSSFLGMVTMVLLLTSLGIASEPPQKEDPAHPMANKAVQKAKQTKKSGQQTPGKPASPPAIHNNSTHDSSTHNNKGTTHNNAPPAHKGATGLAHASQKPHGAGNVVVEIQNPTSIPVFVSAGGQGQLLEPHSSVSINATEKSGQVTIKAEWGREGAKRSATHRLKVNSGILHATIVGGAHGTSIIGIK